MARPPSSQRNPYIPYTLRLPVFGTWICACFVLFILLELVLERQIMSKGEEGLASRGLAYPRSLLSGNRLEASTVYSQPTSSAYTSPTRTQTKPTAWKTAIGLTPASADYPYLIRNFERQTMVAPSTPTPNSTTYPQPSTVGEPAPSAYLHSTTPTSSSASSPQPSSGEPAPSAYLHSKTPTSSSASSSQPSTGEPAPSTYLQLEQTQLAYFIGNYLPTLIAVLLTMVWRVIDTRIKRIDPIHQLSTSNGASGKSTLCDATLLLPSYVAPLHAALKGRWVVCISSVIAFPLLTAVQLLGPATIFLKPNCADGTSTGCSATLTVRKNAGRLLEILLLLMAFLALYLAIAISRREHKLYPSRNPFTIAGIACLVSNAPSGALSVFDKIGYDDNTKTLEEKLSHRWFRLSQSPGGSTIHLEECASSPTPLSQNGLLTHRAATKFSAYGYEATSSVEEEVTDSVHEPQRTTGRPHVDRPLAQKSIVIFIFSIILIGVFCLILVYRFTDVSQTRGFERFMDSQGYGVEVFMVALGTIIRAFWEPLERDVRAFEIYRKLSHRHQRAEETLFVDYSNSVPFYTEVVALLNRDVFVAYIGTVGILVEVLVVALSGISFKNTTSYRGHTVSTYLSVSIIGLMLLSLLGIFFRRRKPCLARQPYTLASVVAYVYKAGMLKDFREVPRLGDSMVEEKVGKLQQKSYGYGWVKGTDGVVRVGVDEEELYADYDY